jgi:hypothetical protein
VVPLAAAVVTRKDREGRERKCLVTPVEYTRLDSHYPKSSQDQAETTHQGPLAHALPTSLPADLAEVVELWESLTPEVRAEVLGLVRSDLRGRE